MRKAIFVAALVILVAALAAPAIAAPRVVIKGGGWGHGIGMSQYGTYGRAVRGDQPGQILRHYYSGTRVENRKTGRIRVGLLQGRSSISVSPQPFSSGGGLIVFKVEGRKGRVATARPGSTVRVESSGTGGMRLYKNGNRIKKNGISVFGSPAHPVLLRYQKQDSLVRIHEKNNSYAYGHMQFGTYAGCGDFCLRLVVVLPMQKYLYGLGEVPASWPQTALRVQAIAGRTYAFEKIQRSGQHRIGCDCAVYDSVADQAYTGDAKRTGSGQYWDDWKRAVDATHRDVVLYRGAAIQAFYSSSSGGHTEHNENVWGGSPLAYLRGVADGPDAVDANPNHTWRVRMSWGDFERKLQSAYDMGRLKEFKLLKPFGVSGRVTVVKPDNRGGVKIVGSRETVRTSGWSMRSSLALKDTLFRVTFRYRTDDRFSAKKQALGGRVGWATGDAYEVPIDGTSLGVAQDFRRGRMTYRFEDEEIFWQRGPILRRYDKLGREDGRLGMPASDVLELDDHSLARFQNGTIYLVEGAAEPVALWGSIARAYASIGEARSMCGYPVAGVTTTDGVASAAFEHGTIETAGSSGVDIRCG